MVTLFSCYLIRQPDGIWREPDIAGYAAEVELQHILADAMWDQSCAFLLAINLCPQMANRPDSANTISQ